MSDFPRTFPDVRPGAGAVFRPPAYLSLGADNSMMPGTANYTVEASIQSTHKDAFRWIFVSSLVNSWSPCYTRADTGLMRMSIDSGYYSPVGGTDICDGIQHHICISADRDANVSFYVDGVLDGVDDMSAKQDYDITGLTLYVAYVTDPAQQFWGSLRACKLYSGVALSADNIADLCHRRVDPFQAWRDNIMLALDLTQPPQTGGAFPVWPDLSGHNNNAVAHGGVGYQRPISRRVVA